MASDPLRRFGVAVLCGLMPGAPHVAASDHCPPAAVLHGEAQWDHFAAVARIGDVNGDGVADFAVGAMGNDAVGPDSGKVYVHDGATQELIYALNGEAPQDNFGLVVAGVGDINGDGRPDLAVDAPYHVNTKGLYGVGRVYLFSGPTGELLRTFDGPASGGFYGYSIDGPGDIDLDGMDDVLIGHPQAGSGPGRAQVFSGANGDLIREFAGEGPNDWFGSAVAGVSDVDGDGFPELLIGAHNRDIDGPGHGYKQGRAYLYSGRDGSLLHTFDGTGINDSLGSTFADLGDLDLDGFPEIAIGEGLHVNVYSGRDFSIGFVLARAPNLLPLVGLRIARSAGDFDGDGINDIVIGAGTDSTAVLFGGRTFVFSGGNGRAIAVWTAVGVQDHFGWSVDGLGDVNGDGFDDIISGAPDASEPGYVMVFYGHPVLPADITGDGLVNILDFLVMLSEWSVEGQPASDLNQDGVVDHCDLDLLLVNWDAEPAK